MAPSASSVRPARCSTSAVIRLYCGVVLPPYDFAAEPVTLGLMDMLLELRHMSESMRNGAERFVRAAGALLHFGGHQAVLRCHQAGRRGAIGIQPRSHLLNAGLYVAAHH